MRLLLRVWLRRKSELHRELFVSFRIMNSSACSQEHTERDKTNTFELIKLQFGIQDGAGWYPRNGQSSRNAPPFFECGTLFLSHVGRNLHGNKPQMRQPASIKALGTRGILFLCIWRAATWAACARRKRASINHLVFYIGGAKGKKTAAGECPNAKTINYLRVPGGRSTSECQFCSLSVPGGEGKNTRRMSWTERDRERVAGRKNIPEWALGLRSRIWQNMAV